MELSEVDIYDPDNFVEAVPHEMFATLRREAPVFRHAKPDGGHFWCVTRHDDLVHVNRDTKTFASWLGGATLDMTENDLETQRMMMLNMDPPDHTKLRKIVNKGFTPRMIRQLQDHLEQEAKGIVDAVVERGECDFVVDIASELPLIAIAEFLGVPREDRKLLFELSNRLIGFDDPEFQTSREDAMLAGGELYAFAEALAAERRKEPKDDIVSALLQAEVDGERLSDLEFDLFFLLLSVAGNETTRNAISHGMHAFMEHPDQYAKLVEDPSLIDSAIEEILRWATPVMNFRRTTTVPAVIHDVEIPENEPVVFWHMSANRDDAVFDDPFTFDITRDPNLHTGHVAFGGGGPHFCLGANLARAEMRVMFLEITKRIPDMRLTAPPRRLRSNFINGIKEMRVEFNPSAA
jgi:cholest-4-en-3-one 26-monooxygenase